MEKESGRRWQGSARETKEDRQARRNTERRRRQLGEILKLKNQGLGRRRIAKELGIAEKTVQNYLAPDFDPADKRIGTRKMGGKTAPYADEIFELYSKGLKLTQILQIIREKGYSGHYNTLHAYVTREKKRRAAAQAFCGGTSRTKAISVLYQPDSGRLTDSQVERIAEAHPVYKDLLVLVTEFRELFSAGDPKKLDDWLEKAASLNSAPVNSFVNGIIADKEAVSAAIESGMTSGAVEGSVTKIKLAKRIMYGRCSFELLRCKILHRELRKAQRRKEARSV